MGRGEGQPCFLCCVYLPTDSSSVAVVDNCYDKLKEDVLGFREKGSVVLLGDFNARVGRSANIDDVIGLLGEDTCNASGNRLVSFMNEVELVAWNGERGSLLIYLRKVIRKNQVITGVLRY